MRNILVTGATGVIGSALIPRLMDEHETVIHLIVRAKSTDHLQQRMASLFEFWDWNTSDLSLGGRLHAYRGDVCRPKLGLNDADHSQLIREVSHVIHSAGTVKLNRTIEQARKSAVGAAERIVAFCRSCQSSGRFSKLDYVSTVGVAGCLPGLVPEEPLTQPRTFHNTYEQAKAEAETYLWDEMSNDLPTTIHRPSMVVGDSRTGKVIHFQVFYHLSEFLAGRRTLGVVPDTGDAALDIIPSDYVAQAIQLASNEEDAVGRVFHLCSGPDDMVNLMELGRAAHSACLDHGKRPRKLRCISLPKFQKLFTVAKLTTTGRTRRLLHTLPAFLAYLAERQQFSNSATKSWLMSHGIDTPAHRTCLPTMLAYYLQHGSSSKTKPATVLSKEEKPCLRQLPQA